jgi:hypothetical protein
MAGSSMRIQGVEGIDIGGWQVVSYLERETDRPDQFAAQNVSEKPCREEARISWGDKKKR